MEEGFSKSYSHLWLPIVMSLQYIYTHGHVLAAYSYSCTNYRVALKCLIRENKATVHAY